MNFATDEKTLVFQNQIKKLQSRKDGLVKELDRIEEQFKKMNKSYGDAFQIVIDTLVTGEGLFSDTCRNLNQALKKRESEGRIAYILEQLKTVTFREELISSGSEQGKKNSPLLKKDGLAPFIDECKRSYSDAVNHLRSNLDEKYTGKLDHIAAGIKTAENTSDINDIRENIFNLIFVYLSDTHQDRERLNAFIREIVGKILTIETRFASTCEYTDTIFESNDGFESVLDNEMKRLKETSDMASGLDLLKIQVSERLSSIETALQKKQTGDRLIKEAAEKNKQSFTSGFIKLKQELDEATRYSEELEKKVNQDQLTGAFNRRAYDKKIEEEMARFLRYGTCFSLLLMDVDRFKPVNDQYGHIVGDRCLQEIIKRTFPLLRRNDMLARYGGEEFVVIMPETDINGAREAAEKIRKTIEKIGFICRKDKIRVTVSIGVSRAMEGDKHHHQIFERADIAIYQAKERGRNQVIVN